GEGGVGEGVVVAIARRARRLRQARVVGGIGEDAGERIHLDDVRGAVLVEPYIYARPVTTSQDAIGAEDYVFDRVLEPKIDTGRTLEHVERSVRPIPHPLRFISIDRKRAGGEGLEVHADQGKHARRSAVAEYAARELSAGEKRLGDDWLLVGRE